MRTLISMTYDDGSHWWIFLMCFALIGVTKLIITVLQIEDNTTD